MGQQTGKSEDHLLECTSPERELDSQGNSSSTIPTTTASWHERFHSMIKASKVVLWPGHQRLIAIFTLFSLLAMAVHFSWLAQTSNGLIAIEQVPRIEFQFQVDVNQARWPELFAIPGIGETLAKRIVEYREANGRFESIAALQNVHGLGPKSIERIRPFLLPIEISNARARFQQPLDSRMQAEQ
ncbi:MAG: helix-hairpin-helix domain-containing protein [Planctomycetota bacterium]